jgi:hypothetical protein
MSLEEIHAPGETEEPLVTPATRVADQRAKQSAPQAVSLKLRIHGERADFGQRVRHRPDRSRTHDPRPHQRHTERKQASLYVRAVDRQKRAV